MLEGLQRFFNTYSAYDSKFIKQELQTWHGKILDVGCGDGRLKKILPTDCQYTGLDLYGPGADYKIDITKDPYPFDKESFDFVICNAVLEHVKNPDFVAQEIWRVLKQGGKAYVSIPFLQPYHPDPEDYRRFTSVGLVQFLKHHGFTLVYQREIFGTAIVIEYLCFFELIQFIKHPQRFLNPLRYIQLIYLSIIYSLSRLYNFFFVQFFQNDSYASPGAKAIVKKS